MKSKIRIQEIYQKMSDLVGHFQGILGVDMDWIQLLEVLGC